MVFCLCLLIRDYKEYVPFCGWHTKFLMRPLICLSPDFFDWSHVNNSGAHREAIKSDRVTDSSDK